MAVMFLVLIVQHTGACARDTANCGSFAASRQCTYRGATHGADANPFRRFHVALVPNILRVSAIAGHGVRWLHGREQQPDR